MFAKFFVGLDQIPGVFRISCPLAGFNLKAQLHRKLVHGSGTTMTADLDAARKSARSGVPK